MDIDGLIEAVADYTESTRGCDDALEHGARGGYHEHARLRDAASARIDEIVDRAIDARVSVAVDDLIARLSGAGVELPEV